MTTDQIEKCGYCLNEIEGGTLIIESEKKVYFCSGGCLNSYEREKKNDRESNKKMERKTL